MSFIKGWSKDMHSMWGVRPSTNRQTQESTMEMQRETIGQVHAEAVPLMLDVREKTEIGILELKDELCRLQSEVDAFEEKLEQVVEMQRGKDKAGMARLVDDVRELMEYLQECERDGSGMDWKDTGFRVMKWAIEDTLREIK